MSIKTNIKNFFKSTLISTGYFTGVKCAPFYGGSSILQKIKMPYCFFNLEEIENHEINRVISIVCDLSIEAWFKLDKHTEEDVFDLCDSIETLIHSTLIEQIKQNKNLQKFIKLPTKYEIPDDVYGFVSMKYIIGFMTNYNNLNSKNL